MGSEVIQSPKHHGETGRGEGAQPLGSLLWGGAQDRQGSRLDTDGMEAKSEAWSMARQPQWCPPPGPRPGQDSECTISVFNGCGASHTQARCWGSDLVESSNVHTLHVLLELGDLLLQQVCPHLVVLHHALDLQLADAIAHRNQLGAPPGQPV